MSIVYYSGDVLIRNNELKPSETLSNLDNNRKLQSDPILIRWLFHK